MHKPQLTDDEIFELNKICVDANLEKALESHDQIKRENGRTGLGLIGLWRGIHQSYGIALPFDFEWLFSLLGRLQQLIFIVAEAVARLAATRPQPPPQAASRRARLIDVNLSQRLLPPPAARA